MYNQNSGFKRIVSQTISDKVYDGLRNAIITLDLKPGDEINVKSISENLGVSRSPVRDALLRLEKEGLVDIVPQKGTCVSRIDLSRANEERFLRACLEDEVIRLFIKRHGENDISRLRQSLDLQQDSLEKKDYISFLSQDDLFHETFFQATEKTMCWHIIQSMSGHYRRVRLISLWNAKIISNVISQHAELL